MTFTLSSGRSSATIRTFGGELISYIHDGIEYIWQGDPAYWNDHSPILFPVCCYPMNGKVAYDGIEYPMPKHGFANSHSFEPVYISKDRVILEQRETDETLRFFPFCYSLKVEYVISDEGFYCNYYVKNLDKNEMTFCIGGHPGFNCPMRPEDGGFEDYTLIFDDATDSIVSISKDEYMSDEIPKINVLKGTNELPLRWADYDLDSLIVENLPKSALNLVSNITGRGIRFNFTGFKALGIWTPERKHAPFICLEPWNGLPADVSETTDVKSKKYAITIKPDEEYSVGFTVTIIQ